MLSIQQKLDKQIKITGIFCLLDFGKVASGGGGVITLVLQIEHV